MPDINNLCVNYIKQNKTPRTETVLGALYIPPISVGKQKAMHKYVLVNCRLIKNKKY